MLLVLIAWGVFGIGPQEGFLQPADDYIVVEYHETRVVDKDSGIEEVTIYQKSQKPDFGPDNGFMGQGAFGMDGHDMPGGPAIGGMGLETPCGCSGMDDKGECGCRDKGIERDPGAFGGPMIGKRDNDECSEGCPFGFGSDNQPGFGGQMNGFMPPDIFQGNGLAPGSYNDGNKGGFDHGHEDWDTENCPFGGDGHKQDLPMGNNGMLGQGGPMGQGQGQGNFMMPDPMIMMGGNNMMSDPMSMMGGNNMMPDPMSMMGGNNMMPDPMSMMGGNNMMPGSQNANNFGEDPFGSMVGPNGIM
ncbi:hypothetical protein SteCoe_29750 [Stentor coeruleus]|uniref:Uncharacterized protein n=1 Tax=Stentor coeruleus TaxID=5963 RepID=A0A1R2B566_9CILI|nr:hypothetical protein SteCoe_29750 [Stentor coeruleus]